MAKIAKNIKQFRTERKLTQEALAEQISVTRQTVSSWETGRTQPDVEMLESLSAVFGVSLEELIYGEKNRVGLEPENKPNKRIFIIVLTLFGTALTVAGIALLFVTFWESLIKAKNVFAFLPLLAGAGLAVYAAVKKPGRIAWNESTAAAWTAGIVCTNALLSSLNHLYFGFDWILFLDTLLVLPVVLLTNAVIPKLFWFGGATAFFVLLTEQERVLPFVIFAVVTAAMLVFGMIYDGKHKTGDARDVIMFWIKVLAAAVWLAVLTWGVLVVSGLTIDIPVLFFLGLSFFSCLYFLGDRFSSRAVRKVAMLPLPLALYFIGRFIRWNNLPYLQWEKAGLSDLYGSIGAVCVIFALTVAVFCFSAKKLLADKIRFAVACAVLVFLPCVFASFFIPGGREWLSLWLMLPAFLLDVLLVILGVVSSRLSTANLGMISAVVVFASLLIGESLEPVVIGLCLVAVGVILLTVNRILIRRFGEGTGEVTANG